MGGMCVGHKISWVLLVIGGLNWGLVGLGGLLNMNLNVVNLLLGRWPMVASLVYLLVGIATVMMLCKHSCKMCMMEKGGKKM